MKIIYPDTPIVRLLADQPEMWDKLYDPFIEEFGRSFRVFPSYYLFFEYISFTKEYLEIPLVFKTPHFEKISNINFTSKGIRDEDLLILNSNLAEIEIGLEVYIKQKLYSLKSTFKQLIKDRSTCLSSFEAAKKLEKAFFGKILSLIDNNFEEFVKYATIYLGWDSFCSIHPAGLPLKVVRELQLGIWLKRWKQGVKLPFGKIIDDQSGYYEMSFRSHFKNSKDMVDSEMHTVLILGHEIDGQIHPVHCLTHPPKDKNAIQDRTRLVLGSIDNIQKTLKKEIPKFPGKIYSLDEKTHCIIEIHEPIFPIILENCSGSKKQGNNK